MARYQDAISWIVENDDTDFLKEETGTGSGRLSLTACMVADLFGKSDKQVRTDLIEAERKYRKKLIRCAAQRIRGDHYR